MFVRVLLCFPSYSQCCLRPMPTTIRVANSWTNTCDARKPPEIDSQDVVRITTNLVQVDVVVTKGDKVCRIYSPRISRSLKMESRKPSRTFLTFQTFQTRRQRNRHRSASQKTRQLRPCHPPKSISTIKGDNRLVVDDLEYRGRACTRLKRK